MSENNSDSTKVNIHLLGNEVSSTGNPLPGLLQDASRSGDSSYDAFINDDVLDVEAVYDLSQVARGTGTETTAITEGDRLLALEAEDGTTLFIRADKLREELARLYPEAIRDDGSLDLSVLRDREATSRGLIDWAWSKLSVIGLNPDPMIDKAQEKAQEWVLEKLGERFKDKAEELSGFSASTLGAKALMWAIESRASEPGLYLWQKDALSLSDRVASNDDKLKAAAAEGPILLFIHGTASHTRGSFGELRKPAAASDWGPLRKQYGNRIYGFEHRTFSESPIDNTLALAKTLPADSELAIVTHSRGGLVGDLLCLAGLPDELIENYRSRSATDDSDEESAADFLNSRIAEEEQQKLEELRDLLEKKNFRIKRYIRVACPASGTTLLSDNLELFLSGLLSLMSSLVGAITGPGSAPVMSAFKRIVLEIADKRLDPSLVPGIEAMLTDSPMSTLLARAERKQGIDMAVISGDIEGGNFLKRLGVMLTDWMFFDRQENDLVVDTRSMYAGLARHKGTRYLFDTGPDVNHFSYFSNPSTREALRLWLTHGEPEEISAFSPLARRTESEETTRGLLRAPKAPDNTRPVVIVLPGIMGTHLEINRGRKRPGHGNRVWLDPFELMRGGIDKIGYANKTVRPEALFEMFYGELVEALQNTHAVIPFPYDWRHPIQDNADLLAKVVDDALEKNPDQPVRLLAHSMGGLVTRAMISRHETLWNEIVKRPGGRFIMLGTPNHGSHAMVETLLGKSGSIRNLARADLAHRMQEILDIIAGFPGVAQLLPRPGFQDTGDAQADDYLAPSLWENYKVKNRDRWFGDNNAAIPTRRAIDASNALWKTVLCEKSGSLFKEKAIPSAERICYVFGQAKNTACGIREENGQLKMIGTPEGDGSVSWASGRLGFLKKEQYWYMPVDHGSLAKTEKYFGAITELLQTGDTSELGKLPVSRGTSELRTYDAGPTPFPSDEELVMSLMSSHPRPLETATVKPRLAVSVKAMDLRNAQVPIMCGHYIGDPMAGAEAAIDRHLVNNALLQRQALGIYADKIGTSTVVLMPRKDEDLRRGSHRGAVILGLGEMGELSIHQVTETVRAGVLNYLLHMKELDASLSRQESDEACLPEIGIASLLIGYNSTTLGDIENFVDAIVLGVCEANREFTSATDSDRWVCRLEFIELFLDTAISAAHALKEINTRLASSLQQLDVELEPGYELEKGDGVRQRLAVSGAFGYWPRLQILNADEPETSPSPDNEETTPSSTSPVLPARLKYTFLSARARAEIEFQQSQPGLIEKLVEFAIRQPGYNADLSRTLFQLMVPLSFKATARDMTRLHLLLDGYTANLPWEMLQADDEPMVIKTAMVRQLASKVYRKQVQTISSKTACVIADPSTHGFAEAFDDEPLPTLPGAEEEGRIVRRSLESANYKVTYIPAGTEFSDVLTRLFCNPSRILMIAAHGVYQARDRDGRLRTGVVLSDGQLLTAAEVGQLEAVPDIAFLNCCHLGSIDNQSQASLPKDVNKFAYSLARELIEMGVRCVVVAGWAVNDMAAQTFAVTFFDEMLDGAKFGDAVHTARCKTYDNHRGNNTWGAYQAYGDPVFVLDRNKSRSSSSPEAPVAVEELLASLEWLHNEVSHNDWNYPDTRNRVLEMLKAAPASWSKLPRVQAEIGRIYGELSEDGFVAACEAYARAISLEDRDGAVAIKTIEQLANLEARSAERLCDEAPRNKRKSCIEERALGRVSQSIDRLKNLQATVAATRIDSNPAAGVNINQERQGLLGSAYKIRAKLLLDMGTKWTDVKKDLVLSRDAYAAGQGSPEDSDFNPYAMINRLHLDALLNPGKNVETIESLALQCRAAATNRFKESNAFWDAVMSAGAELAIQLVNNELDRKKNEEQLTTAYKEALTNVPRSKRKFDSVEKQFRLLAAFLKLRDKYKRKKADQSEVLLRILDRIEPGRQEKT